MVAKGIINLGDKNNENAMCNSKGVNRVGGKLWTLWKLSSLNKLKGNYLAPGFQERGNYEGIDFPINYGFHMENCRLVYFPESNINCDLLQLYFTLFFLGNVVSGK